MIRGLSYNRVLTINDGVRQEGQQWGDEHGIEVDEVSVNKIELLKGPASIIYGSDAMAGVINIISNVPVPSNTFKANISSNYQSNNRLRSFNVNTGGNKNGFNWNLYTSNKASADYKNKYDGRVFNSKFSENNIRGYAGYNGKWGFSHLLLSRFNLKAGLIEGERSYVKLMMWFFLLSDAFSFSALLITYGLVRSAHPTYTGEVEDFIFSQTYWPIPEKVFEAVAFFHGLNAPLVFVGIMTFILIMSSVTMVLAVEAGQRMDKRADEKWMLWTLLGGICFLSCQAWEWAHFIHGTGGGGANLVHNEYGPPDFAAFFFFITGFHGFHVFSGVLLPRHS